MLSMKLSNIISMIMFYFFPQFKPLYTLEYRFYPENASVKEKTPHKTMYESTKYI